jgi:hypothetical protein
VLAGGPFAVGDERAELPDNLLVERIGEALPRDGLVTASRLVH